MLVTDLFVAGTTKFTENDTALFDDVMGHLIIHIENRALIELSTRLAPVAKAPKKQFNILRATTPLRFPAQF
jgi:hypothetical protein